MKYRFIIGTLIMSLFLLTSVIMVYAQTDTNLTNMKNTSTINKEISVSIGELIFESKTRMKERKYQILINKNLKFLGQVMEH